MRKRKIKTRPFSELRDSVMESWDAETHELYKKAELYFESKAGQQLNPNIKDLPLEESSAVK